MNQIIVLTCEECNCSFERRVHDHNYNTKKDRQIFCSLVCSRKHTKEIRTQRIIANRSSFDITTVDHTKDPYLVAFTFILLKARGRNRGVKEDKVKEVSITIEDLQEQWDKQKGICVYSGVHLLLPSARKRNNRLTTASLDRIDSIKGYVKGNIQFVSIMANTAKGVSTHEEMLEFCRIIRCNQQNN